MDTCQICLDSGLEPIYEIKLCKCRYKCHNSCWVDYVHSQPRVRCLICRKPIQTPPVTKSSLHAPQIVRANAPIVRPYTTTTYQSSGVYYQPLPEVPHQEVVVITTVNPNTRVSQQQNQNTRVSQQQNSTIQNSRFKKIVEAVCVIALITIIITIIVTLL
jgi:hypothetical protein